MTDSGEESGISSLAEDTIVEDLDEFDAASTVQVTFSVRLYHFKFIKI